MLNPTKISTLAPRLMSALGQKQTCAVHQPMSALPPIATAKADITDACFRLWLQPCGQNGLAGPRGELVRAFRQLGVAGPNAPSRSSMRVFDQFNVAHDGPAGAAPASSNTRFDVTFVTLRSEPLPMLSQIQQRRRDDGQNRGIHK